MIPYIIGGILILAIAAFLGVFIAARLKGKLELTVDKNGFAPGETISGNLKLTTKKAIEGNRLFVALVCFEEIRRDRDGDGDRETQRNEIYREEVDLEGAGTMPAGTERAYSFEIAAPGHPAQGGESSTAEKAMGVLASGLKAFGHTEHRKIWEVQARYDAKGIDLTAKRKVTVSE